MAIIDREYLISAHKASSLHYKQVMESDICGCFYCLATFTPDEISYWVDEDNPQGATALCAKCDIDAVIGSSSGFPVNDQDFLKQMRKRFFNN